MQTLSNALQSLCKRALDAIAARLRPLYYTVSRWLTNRMLKSGSAKLEEYQECLDSFAGRERPSSQFRVDTLFRATLDPESNFTRDGNIKTAGDYRDDAKSFYNELIHLEKGQRRWQRNDFEQAEIDEHLEDVKRYLKRLDLQIKAFQRYKSTYCEYCYQEEMKQKEQRSAQENASLAREESKERPDPSRSSNVRVAKPAIQNMVLQTSKAVGQQCH